MFTLLISLIVAGAGVGICIAFDASTAGAVWAGIAGFVIAQILSGLVIRKRTKKVQDELQGLLMSGQQQMNRKIQQFQSRPGGNIKQIQRQLEKEQNELITEALAFVDRFEPFKKWNLFMGRQIATMRMQFSYQLKDFEEVDRLLATGGVFTGPMMMEPVTVAMKMARQYSNKDFEGLEKSFKRHLVWFRGSRGALIYGLMSWVYLKQGEDEKARQLLIKGKEATGNETLAHNLDMLTNNKPKHFSNSGLGEEWYSLYLENPPTAKQQRMRAGRGGRTF
jgi:hypothetical protein